MTPRTERAEVSDVVHADKRAEITGPPADLEVEDAPPQEEQVEVVKEHVGLRLSVDVRNRARAAFRAAAYFEGCRSFGDFVDGALEREIARIEKEHLNGETLTPLTENLPAGRKV